MSITTAVEDGTLSAVFDRIRESLRTERTRTQAELAAFEAFGDRIADIQSTTPGRQPTADQPLGSGDGAAVAVGARHVGRGSTRNPAESIRTAYTETVMSLPFYESEYGEPYQESVRAEFGRELGTSLTESACLGPVCLDALQRKLEQIRTERRNLIETCEREAESIDQAAADLRPVADEVESIELRSAADRNFGALEAKWTRVGVLLDHVEDVAAERQTVIGHHRAQYQLPVDAPGICAYLYAELPTSYPVLYLCSDLARDVEELRGRIERAMQTAP